MAMTTLAVQSAVQAGFVPSFTAANVDGHGVENLNGNVVLYVKNGSASPITVTVATPGTVEGLAITDLAVTVANASEKIIGPFKKAVFNQDLTTPALNSAIAVTFSAVTTVTVAAIKVAAVP